MADTDKTRGSLTLGKPLILASGSPRRRELLALAGFDFTVLTCDTDEHTDRTAPAEVVCELSSRKAMAVADSFKKPCYVIGADTIVALDSEILGKPGTTERAKEMITRLQGRTHHVYTGVSIAEVIADGAPVRMHTFYECTEVNVCSMSEAEIDAYAASGEPLDKAGGYGIQGSFGIYISSINGDYYNVVGLPIARLYHELKSFCSDI